MKYSESNELRKQIKEILRDNNKSVENPSGIHFGITLIDEIQRMIKWERRESKKSIKGSFSTEIYAVNLEICLCFLLSISMYPEFNDKNLILPKNWINIKLSLQRLKRPPVNLVSNWSALPLWPYRRQRPAKR